MQEVFATAVHSFMETAELLLEPLLKLPWQTDNQKASPVPVPLLLLAIETLRHNQVPCEPSSASIESKRCDVRFTRPIKPRQNYTDERPNRLILQGNSSVDAATAACP
jgi:hypothetical protein